MSISTPASSSPESSSSEVLPIIEGFELSHLEDAVFTFDTYRSELEIAIAAFKEAGVFTKDGEMNHALTNVIRQFLECVDVINCDSKQMDKVIRIKYICSLIIGEERDRLEAVAELAPLNKGNYSHYTEENLNAQVEAIYDGLNTEEERRQAVLDLFQGGLLGDMEITLNYFEQNRHALLRQWGAVALAALDALGATRRALGNRKS